MGTVGGRCIALAPSLASIHFQAMAERREGGESLLSHKKVTDWAPQLELLGFNLDMEKLTTSLPPRNIRELQELLEEGPERRRTATVRDILVLAGKLHHVSYVIRPGRPFVRWLLQLSKLRLNGEEKVERGGRGGGVGRRRKP